MHVAKKKKKLSGNFLVFSIVNWENVARTESIHTIIFVMMLLNPLFPLPASCVPSAVDTTRAKPFWYLHSWSFYLVGETDFNQIIAQTYVKVELRQVL